MMERNQLNLYQHLKSVAIMLQPDEKGEDFLPGSQQLIDWLARYDNWFKESVGINDGERPYTLYNREVSLFGVDLLSVPDKLKGLAAASIEKGYAISFTVDIVDLYRQFDVVQSLCGASLLSSLGIIIDNIDLLAEHTAVADFMEKIVHLRLPVGLIGPVSLLRKHHILSLDAMNATDITIYPSMSATSPETSSMPNHPVNKCANRIQLYIDNDGHMYPCLGMLGLKDYAMGHIDQEISETALSGGHYKLNLPQLMNKGPDLTTATKPRQRMTTLPWICEQHRAELLEHV
ncbi:hypothetical protein [Paenibacillus chungangensis]|uniref:4Fe4S-binding SPASM domain-containing protein n=1 Tax=Paenibacillus chungangensis TaxID=696535 RepID=A0ABW3HKI0_9BACL